MTATDTILARLEEGATRVSILLDFDIEGDDLVRFARNHGYGFNAASGRAQRIAKPRPDTHIDRPHPAPTLTSTAPETAMAAPVRPADANLVTEGLHHDSVKIRTLAGKAKETLDKLAAAIDEHDSKAAALEKVQRLAAELEEARAALRPGSAPKGDSAAIRAWARENGVDCPSRGTVPMSVREQYDEAQAS